MIADRVGETDFIFLAGLHGAERDVAERLLTLANGRMPWPWIDAEKALPWVFLHDQDPKVTRPRKIGWHEPLLGVIQSMEFWLELARHDTSEVTENTAIDIALSSTCKPSFLGGRDIPLIIRARPVAGAGFFLRGGKGNH